jgi:hypothetical protein
LFGFFRFTKWSLLNNSLGTTVNYSPQYQ